MNIYPKHSSRRGGGAKTKWSNPMLRQGLLDEESSMSSVHNLRPDTGELIFDEPSRAVETCSHAVAHGVSVDNALLSRQGNVARALRTFWNDPYFRIDRTGRWQHVLHRARPTTPAKPAGIIAGRGIVAEPPPVMGIIITEPKSSHLTHDLTYIKATDWTAL
jgi:hypothetical protein